MKTPVLSLAAAILLLPFSLYADDLLPMGEIDRVSVRELPAYTAVEAEVTGAVETSWEKAYRQDIRYAAEVHSQVGWPVVVIYPEWEIKPPEPKTRFLVQLILDGTSSPERLPPTRIEGLKITDMPATTVVGCAYRGAYTLDNFKKTLAKVENYVKEKDLKPVGPPRHLYFSNTSWTPAFWRVSEVQIPIAPGSVSATR